MPKTQEKQGPAKPRPKKNGYKFPDPLPQGLVLRDTAKRDWIIGPSIGKGGFGEIYSASRFENSSHDKSYPFVIKIEPHENGPLFVEKHFYIKVAQPEDVNNWKKQKGIKILGIPTYNGSGSHDHKNVKYRFLVIERFGQDLWSTFIRNHRKFPPPTVYLCALQIIDVLEYIHSKGFTHGDIKGANLLMGLKKGTENNIFLVDFGLACKYNTKEFKEDKKRAHNGTIEYTSRDAHVGVPTRRGDMEILGFNLLHWLASTLPWEKDIKSQELVAKKKNDLMKNVASNLARDFPQVPRVISDYLTYVSNMGPNDEPNYDYCRGLFLKELKKLSCPLTGKLDFSPAKAASPVKGRRSRSASDNPKPLKRSKPTPKRGTKRQAVHQSDEEDMFASDSEEPTATVDRSTQTQTPPVEKPKTTRKPRAKKKDDGPPKMSWRDAPTIQASKIAKAGEYISQNPVKRKPASKNK